MLTLSVIIIAFLIGLTIWREYVYFRHMLHLETAWDNERQLLLDRVMAGNYKEFKTQQRADKVAPMPHRESEVDESQLAYLHGIMNNSLE